MKRRRWHDRLAGVLATVLGGLFGAAVIVLWGIVDLAASSGHHWLVQEVLEVAMRRSVVWHARHVDAPDDLDDPDRVQLGAAHFQGGCAMCHGAPGQRKDPVVSHMLPVPPALWDKGRDFEPEEKFWVVRHGLKYAGMPAWSGNGRDDEVWHVVAFLNVFPHTDEEEYRALVWGNLDQGDGESAEQILKRGSPTANIAACGRCHDDGESGPTSRYVPRLSGLGESYLRRAMAEYAGGHRESGIMEPIAAELSDEDLAAIATFYARLPVRPHAARAADTELVSRGQDLALTGAPERGVPPCASCHSGRRPDYPALQGQSAAYLEGQLALWRSGGRSNSPHGLLMAEIGRRLTPEEAAAAAAYYASQPVGTTEVLPP